MLQRAARRDVRILRAEGCHQRVHESDRVPVLREMAVRTNPHGVSAVMTPTAHCMKCGERVQPVKVTRVTYPNGRTAERGQCPRCGKVTMKFVKAGA